MIKRNRRPKRRIFPVRRLMKFNADIEYTVCWKRKEAMLVSLRILVFAIFKKEALYGFISKACTINFIPPNQPLDSDTKSSDE